MADKKQRSCKLDATIDKKMVDFAEIHYDGNISMVITKAIVFFLETEKAKRSDIPEELVNSILFSRNILNGGRRDEITWNLLREEAIRACHMINEK
jgi:hypothetical protein